MQQEHLDLIRHKKAVQIIKQPQLRPENKSLGNMSIAINKKLPETFKIWDWGGGGNSWDRKSVV